MSRMMGLAQPRLTLALGAALVSLARPALAEDPAPAAPAAPAPAAAATTPAPAPVKRAAAKPSLPAKVTVDTGSPDPPWKVRIENTGEKPIRIPADVRLLSFELTSKTSKGQKRKHKCEAPRAMRPSSFPQKRELYLEPGAFYEEVFDPRLLCFGAAADALREGASVKPTFGWAGATFGNKGPFAAQGTDRPEDFQALRKITADEVVVPSVLETAPAIAPFEGPQMEREGSDEGPEAVDGPAP
jgi:hypothetical protein